MAHPKETFLITQSLPSCYPKWALSFFLSFFLVVLRSFEYLWGLFALAAPAVTLVECNAIVEVQVAVECECVDCRLDGWQLPQMALPSPLAVAYRAGLRIRTVCHHLKATNHRYYPNYLTNERCLCAKMNLDVQTLATTSQM